MFWILKTYFVIYGNWEIINVMEITGNVSRTFQDHVLFLMLFGNMKESRQFMIFVIFMVWRGLYFSIREAQRSRKKRRGPLEVKWFYIWRIVSQSQASRFLGLSKHPTFNIYIYVHFFLHTSFPYTFWLKPPSASRLKAVCEIYYSAHGQPWLYKARAFTILPMGSMGPMAL